MSLQFFSSHYLILQPLDLRDAMKSIQDKLSILCAEYEEADPEVVKQLLLALKGSLVESRSVLDQSFVRKKSVNPQYQSLVTTVPKSPAQAKTNQISKDTAKTSRTKIIVINTEAQVKQYLHPYVSMHKNFLPANLADAVLDHLLDTKQFMETREFYLFEEKKRSHSQLAFFYIPEGFSRETATYNGKVDKIHEFSDEMLQSAKLVNDYVNREIIPYRESLPFQQPEYKVSAAVINYFSNLASNLAWHSDRLQAMGPHNYITSISFGATREFRLRRHSEPLIIYSIRLPHNCMLMMHPGCQELFKHCVNPLKKAIQLHPKCEVERFSITYRYFPKQFTDHVPKCKCGIPMKLGRSFKSTTDTNFGKYFWSCESVYQNKSCGEFFWADFDNIEESMKGDANSASTWKAT